MASDTASRTAGVLVGLEGVGLIVLVVWQVVALIGGDSESVATGIALAVLTAVGAAAVLAFAVAVSRGQSWGRSGAIVTQVLILAVALGAVTGALAHPLIALALAAQAIAALVFLVLSARGGGADLSR